MIAILVPTYNPKEGHLRQAIESALAQTERNWTMTIHDDASNCDVKAMIEPYLHDQRIQFIRSDTNRGIGGNWNTTLQKSYTLLPAEALAKAGHPTPTPYIQFLFQDDWWEPEYLRSTKRALDNNPSCALASVAHSYAYEGSIETKKGYEELFAMRRNCREGLHNGWDFLQTWIENGLHPNLIGEPPFVMMRCDALKKAGKFCEDMPQFLDVDMWIRLLQQGDLYVLQEHLGSFRVHSDGASAKNFETGTGLFDRFRCFDRLIVNLDGDKKKHAQKSQQRILESMIQKFLDRVHKGKSINAKGSGSIKAYCSAHPFKTLKACIRVLGRKAQKIMS